MRLSIFLFDERWSIVLSIDVTFTKRMLNVSCIDDHPKSVSWSHQQFCPRMRIVLRTQPDAHKVQAWRLRMRARPHAPACSPSRFVMRTQSDASSRMSQTTTATPLHLPGLAASTRDVRVQEGGAKGSGATTTQNKFGSIRGEPIQRLDSSETSA